MRPLILVNVVATETEGTFRDKDGLVALVELRDRLRAVDGVTQVGSIVPDLTVAALSALIIIPALLPREGTRV